MNLLKASQLSQLTLSQCGLIAEGTKGMAEVLELCNREQRPI